MAVNIEEGGKPKGTGDTEQGVNRTNQNDYGEDNSEDTADTEVELEHFTLMEVFANFHKSCHPLNAVGSITATIELFRLGEDGNIVSYSPTYLFTTALQSLLRTPFSFNEWLT